MTSDSRHRVVIIGGGFGGLTAARRLKHARVRITLIDRRNFHLFQPLLYQVATGGLSPANIAAPLRAVLRRQRNAEVCLGEVTAIDPQRRVVAVGDTEVSYDTLIVATGVGHHYFGHDAWEPLAPGLKTVEDATEIRRRILSAFEAAERNPLEALEQGWLTFVVIGGGPTGLELSGAIAELSRHTLRHDFRHIDPATAQILLVEGVDRVLPSYPPVLSAKASKSLERLGVTVLAGHRVTDITSNSVTITDQRTTRTIPTRNVFWAAGVKASPLGTLLADTTGVRLDPAGRVHVEADCSVPGWPEIFVIGDLAHYAHGLSSPLPGVAPVAIQQGSYVAKLISARLAGRKSKPFGYRNRGSMATIGRAAAVADIAGLRFGGYAAWLTWLFVHLLYLVGFQNRLLVLLQWAWSYITKNRSARLITGDDAEWMRDRPRQAT